MIDFEQAPPGMRVLRAAAGEPHVHLVHSLGDDVVDEGLAAAVEAQAAGHLCALLYDSEAEACGSLELLAELYARRVMAEGRAKGGFMQGAVTLAASSFGCPIAHE